MKLDNAQKIFVIILIVIGSYLLLYLILRPLFTPSDGHMSMMGFASQQNTILNLLVIFLAIIIGFLVYYFIKEKKHEEIEIVNIKPGDEILTLDEHTGKLVVSKVKALMDLYFRKEFDYKINEKKLIIEAEKPFVKFIELFKDKFKDVLGLELEVREKENDKSEVKYLKGNKNN